MNCIAKKLVALLQIAIVWKSAILCAAAQQIFILSKCNIITLDAMRNIHTVMVIVEAAVTKGCAIVLSEVSWTKNRPVPMLFQQLVHP